MGGAAAVGAMMRYGTDQVVAARILAPRDIVFPLGTFVVNIVGSLLLGAVAGLVVNAGIDLRWRTVLGVGLAGGLTTFSTWTYETVRLLEDGSLREAAANIGVSLAVGLAAASLGYALTGSPDRALHARRSRRETAGTAGQRRSDLRFRVVARGGVEPPTFRFSVGRSYQLSYLAVFVHSRRPAVSGRRAPRDW